MTRRFMVTIVRHGETTMNSKRLIQGHTDSELSDVGIDQAAILGRHLANKEKFTKAFSSHLQRAHLTAKIILEKSDNSVDIIIDKRLCERGFGEAEGRYVPDVHEEAKKIGVQFHQYTPPGGESIEEVQERVRAFFEDLFKLVDSEDYTAENVLITTHGGWIVSCMRYLTTNTKSFDLTNFDESSALRIPRNTGVTQFSISAVTNGSQQRKLCFFTCNDSRHLNL